jgi:hypothetical protein
LHVVGNLRPAAYASVSLSWDISHLLPPRHTQIALLQFFNTSSLTVTTSFLSVDLSS